ncbi:MULTISPECIES: 6,7-dimethyl-8-ribityllumazine synthase [Burkholderia]|uniref:6,7-dimethyl-8-ribityllumazine synthase n=1 Tax=Burkholderia TaxID=32008 RepID=UPI00039895F0|nr:MULTISPECIES: 6,7-dimethyl-8-ribityllumazine synthase [Burkholderia]ERJ40646.1 6,7-dimethyl-8-ribityllumazine synthase [Burkholderia sp. AU4i]KMK99397.1 6,7-dimethyl-8-ribityllumazine synthase [Burkholderia cepacia]KML39569.1 6,7-dimethyl-8-ribityllumazine synthase [Burkholderia lata]KMN51646.1 6,7-dimethyl-8-ribityllumazine synthase [Burkholderia sp. LK4]
MEIGQYQPNLEGDGLRIGIVQSRFNEPVCNGLADACVEELERLGVTGEDVLLVSVPGALEIPLALQKLAESGQFDALIALGAVIRGETYHFELVSNESGAGITRIGLDFNLPIANAVLTTENDEQAVARMTEKGRDAARVAVEMANLTMALDQLGDDDEDEEEDEDEDDEEERA